MKKNLKQAGVEALALAKQLKQAADYGAPGMLDRLNEGVAIIAKNYSCTVKEVEVEAQRQSKQ